MRILVLTNLYPNPFQPHRAAFNRQQLQGLSRRHELFVIAPILWTDELAARWGGRPPLPAGRRAECDGIPVVYPRYVYPPKVLRGWYGHCFRWSVRRAFARAVAEFRPDLVYASWAYPDGWAAVDLARRAGLPVVVKVHGSDVLTLGRYPKREQGTLAALRRADAVVVVSRDLAEHLAARGMDPGRTRVIYNGVDPNLFRPGPRDEARARLGLEGDEPVLLFVGNLVPVKGIDVLLKACGLLVSAELPFACHLIGDGPLRPRLERQARELGVAGRVRFHGARPHRELPDWYRAASVAALPSRSEGVPNVLLEAAACGVPFVASRVGGIPEVAARPGFSRLVPLDDPTALAAVLRYFLTTPAPAGNPPPARDIGAVVGELSDLFEETLQQRQPAALTL